MADTALTIGSIGVAKKLKDVGGSAVAEVVAGIVRLVSATFTRPSGNTTQYTSGDLVANNVTAGSVTPMSFTAGTSGSIRRARLRKSGTSVTSAQFRLHLYRASPTCANGDNGVWSTDKAADYLGAIDITVDRAFTDGAAGNGVPISGSEVNFAISGGTIYGLLEARASYTPGDGESFTVELEILP